MIILILYIYSESDYYNNMLQIHRTYCNKFEDVHSYFITYRQNQKNNVEIENDIIYIRGEETYLGITHKTIDAIEYLLDNMPYKADYIVRTNISTIINISELKIFCNSLQNENIYTSGNMLKLQNIDKSAGIVDDSLFGTIYASGTSIVMSNDIATSLVKGKQNVRHDIIDDASIGVFMNTYLPQVFNQNSPIAKFVVVPFELDPNKIDKNAVFYRNRSGEDRTNDSKNMKIICDILYSEKDNRDTFRDRSSTNNNIMYYGGTTLILCAIGYITYKLLFGKKMRKK